MDWITKLCLIGAGFFSLSAAGLVLWAFFQCSFSRGEEDIYQSGELMPSREPQLEGQD